MNDGDAPKKVVKAELILKEDAPKYWPQSADGFATDLANFLETRGLPGQNVLVPVTERRKLFLNLDPALESLSGEMRANSHYVSKFVASAAVGLFDASLNYVWNETILALRRRVAGFDLNYFFDAVLAGAKDRSKYTSEDDLKKIEDWQFIKGCKDTGIISEIAFVKLDHIREMRNFASAAHPNHVELTGLELASYLESCNMYVLSKPPEQAAVNNKVLLQNLRAAPLTQKDAEPICLSIDTLAQPYASALLRALFGMYVDPTTSNDVRANIELVAKSAWNRADEETRSTAGIQYGKFSANAETDKKGLARKFLESVDGLNYMSDDMRAIEVKERTEGLWAAHQGFNNFYNEESHALALSRLVVNSSQAVPALARREFVRVVTECYLGNGYGVANSAVPYYKRIMDAWTQAEVVDFLRLCGTAELKAVFNDASRAERYKRIADGLLEKKWAPDITAALKTVSLASTSELKVGKTWITIKDTVERAPQK